MNEICGFKTLGRLGFGTFSSVYLGEDAETGARVAIKIFPKTSSPNPAKEIAILRLLDHPFIAKLFGVSEDKDNYYLLMEYAENGNLLQQIERHGHLPISTCRRICIQFISVLDYLHNFLRIVHLDIKPENVVLDRNRNIKLIDFGLSQVYDKDSLTITCGSTQYIAPEILKGEKYGNEADIWSLGILLYCCSLGHFPFNYSSIQQTFYHIVSTEPKYPESLPEDFVDLLKKMLNKDPKQRITINEMKNHPFVTDFDFSSLGLSFQATSSVKDMIDKLIQNQNALLSANEKDIISKVNERLHETDVYASMGDPEVIDSNKIDIIPSQKHVYTPLMVEKCKDPMKFLAKRIATGMPVKGRHKSSSRSLSPP